MMSSETNCKLYEQFGEQLYLRVTFLIHFHLIYSARLSDVFVVQESSSVISPKETIKKWDKIKFSTENPQFYNQYFCSPD